MWRYALLGTSSLVAASYGVPNEAKNSNSSVLAVSDSRSFQEPAYSATDVTSSLDTTTPDGNQSPSPSNPSSQNPAYVVTDVVSSYSTSAVADSQSQVSMISNPSSIQLSSRASAESDPKRSFTSMNASPLTWNPPHSTASPRTGTYAPSGAPFPYKNITSTSTRGTAPITRGSCTGCALAALNPSTAVYQSNMFGNWTSLVVTETILTEFVTYLDGSTVDTVVTESKTINQTKTVNGFITDTRPTFNIYLPTPGLLLTLDVGPTYVLYTDLFGGPDAQVHPTAPNNATHSKLRPTQSTCRPHVSSLRHFVPTRTEDWAFFIQTFNGSAPEPTPMDSPVPVPSKLTNFLAQDQDLQVQFQGADINTCTLAGISEILIGDPNRTFNPPAAPSTLPPEGISAKPTATATKSKSLASSSRPPFFPSLPGTNTYLSTTYASTSKHVTRLGCLRCDTNVGDLPKTPKPTEQDANTNKVNESPRPTPPTNPKNDDTPKPNDKPSDKPKGDDNAKTDSAAPNQPQNTAKPDTKTTPSVPDIINSIISGNPSLTRKPQEHPNDPGQTITIGNSVVTVKPQPTKQGQGGPNQQTNAPTMVVIGTQTVTVGQTTTINGVPIVVPTAGQGSTIIVGDKTIGLNPQITQLPMPVVTVGYNTITADPQGQFVIGTQTLHQGGPELTVDGHTLTLGPNGKIAMWNSATQTIVTMAGPYGAPAVTFGGQPITAKILGGTTVFVFNSQTLAPGRAITVDGTTFSLPSGFHGSSIVVNGQTQRLNAGLPALTINGLPITATVKDGATQFVLAPGETLTAGGVLTISGTTYSLPTSGSGSTIVINGATSRLNPSHLPVLPLGGEAVTATIAQGTTAFVFGPDMTLTPGGVLTVSGTTFSLPASASGSVVVINGMTSTLARGSGMLPVTPLPPITINGQTITATTRDGTAEYVFGSATTLRPNGEIIIEGTTYSLAPGGTAVVINGKTSLISSTPARNMASTTSVTSAQTTSERGAGDFIASGIGGSGKSKGAGSVSYNGADAWVARCIMGVAGWLLWIIY